MAKRAAYTLIFLGAQRTDRVDLGPGPAFPAIEQFHRPGRTSDDPAERVEASLISNPKVGKVVWVLWEGASAQVLDMPSGVVHGMEREQLAGALGFEVEPLTGVPAAESAIDGFQLKNSDGVQPEFRRFWITQLTSDVRDKVDAVVTRAGAKFAGIIHPGGLPHDRWDAQLAPETPHDWWRIEIWDLVTFILHGAADGSVDTRIVRTTPGADVSIADLPGEGPVSWMATAPVAKADPQRLAMWNALLSARSDGNAVEPVQIVFPENATPVDWLRAWAFELTAQKRVPTVEPPSRISPNRKFYVIGGAAAAATLVACLAHAFVLSSRAERAHAEADEREKIRDARTPKIDTAKIEIQVNAETEKLQQELRDLNQRETSLTAEKNHIESAVASNAAHQVRQNRLHAAHRLALAELLAALADSERTDNPGEFFVKEVRQSDTGELRLTGICRRASTADNFANRLQSRLESAGLNVSAAQKLLRSDRLAYDFTLVLTPAVLSESPDAHAPDSPPAKPRLPVAKTARPYSEAIQAAAGGRQP